MNNRNKIKKLSEKKSFFDLKKYLWYSHPANQNQEGMAYAFRQINFLSGNGVFTMV
jgi:hypothetical protein